MRRADKFIVSNRVTLSGNEIVEIYDKRAEIEEVFRLLKGVCQWKKCQFSDDKRYERFLSIGILTFMCWEHSRIASFSPVTIYQLRRNVMFSNYKPRIPIPNYILEVS